MTEAVQTAVGDLLRRQARAVDDYLGDLLRARGVDPDDRSDGWGDRARAALADVEMVDQGIEWVGEWDVRITTVIRPRTAARPR